MVDSLAPRDGRTVDGTIILLPEAAGHLAQAMGHMDSLTSCPDAEQGLPHLVALVRHLRALRSLIA